MRTAVIATAVLVLVSAPRTLAHDPGLSSLELCVSGGRILATLSLAEADARTVVGQTEGSLEALALESIELRADGILLNGIVESRAWESDSGARVVLAFEHPKSSRLMVRSNVPARLSPGHRHLLSVCGPGGQPAAERMLDARHNTADIDLGVLAGDSSVARRFSSLGIHHILSGYDHLLFVCALLLGVRRLAVALRTITAFTVAHSLTLALAALGIAHAPSRVIEPLIAASIVFVGLDNLLRTEVGSRWPLTFAFGLVHGFGFASALQDLGFGGRASDIIAPLAWFNLGVEAGQVAVAALLWPIARLLSAPPALRWHVAPACSALVVAAGAYWLLERAIP